MLTKQAYSKSCSVFNAEFFPSASSLVPFYNTSCCCGSLLVFINVYLYCLVDSLENLP